MNEFQPLNVLQSEHRPAGVFSLHPGDAKRKVVPSGSIYGVAEPLRPPCASPGDDVGLFSEQSPSRSVESASPLSGTLSRFAIFTNEYFH